MPSLSSASSTSHSPLSHTALVPISLTSPPMRKLGRSPASTRIRASIDVVVVLPWVPATATQRRQAAMRGQRLGPAQDDHSPGAGPSATSGLVSAMAVDTATTSASPDMGGVVADEHLHPAGGQALERRASLQVAAGDGVAHGGEHRRDGAHPRTAHPDDVHAVGSRQVEGGSVPTAPSPAGAQATRAAWRGRPGCGRAWARASVRHRRHGVGPAQRRRPPRPWRRAAPGSSAQGVDLGRQSAAVALRVGDDHGCPGALEDRRRWHVWWSPGAPGRGTSTAGTPTTASSATVLAPARPTTTSAAW